MGLLASYLLTLEPLTPGLAVTENTGVKARGLLYDLMSEVDPGLATECHDSEGPKPFTCSMLMGALVKTSERELQLGSGPYRLRYTALSEAVADALSTAFYRLYATATPLALGPLRFRVRRVSTASEEQFWARASTHEALLGTCRDRWRLRFHTPTVFKQQRGHMPLPVPGAIFRSALASWTAPWSKAPALNGDLLRYVNENVFPSRLEIRTKTVPLESATLTGFVGWVDLRVVNPLPAEVLCQLNALLEYTYYCGVGHGTPRGCGQVALLPPAAQPPSE